MCLPHAQLVLLQPALLSSFNLEATLRPRLAYLCGISQLPAESIGPVIVRWAPSMPSDFDPHSMQAVACMV